MEIIPLIIKEMEQEAATTRKFMKLVPMDKLDYKPHEKSMSMMNLATHIAELPGWPALILNTSELNFADQPYEPAVVKTTEELENLFEKSYADGIAALKNAQEEDLIPDWSLKMGDQLLAKWSKYEAIRHAIAQQIHHRAQLGVYLRLLNIPIPGSYGPSADEQSF